MNTSTTTPFGMNSFGFLGNGTVTVPCWIPTPFGWTSTMVNVPTSCLTNGGNGQTNVPNFGGNPFTSQYPTNAFPGTNNWNGGWNGNGTFHGWNPNVTGWNQNWNPTNCGVPTGSFTNGFVPNFPGSPVSNWNGSTNGNCNMPFGYSTGGFPTGNGNGMTNFVPGTNPFVTNGWNGQWSGFVSPVNAPMMNACVPNFMPGFMNGSMGNVMNGYTNGYPTPTGQVTTVGTNVPGHVPTTGECSTPNFVRNAA